jgi:hypothetical protein
MSATMSLARPAGGGRRIAGGDQPHTHGIRSAADRCHGVEALGGEAVELLAQHAEQVAQAADATEKAVRLEDMGQRRPLAAGRRLHQIDELAAVAHGRAVLVDHQEVLTVGRATQRRFARDVEHLEGKTADIGHPVRLDVRPTVGQPDQGAMDAGPGEQPVPGVFRQAVEHFQRAGGREELLAMQRAPLAEFLRPRALQLANDLGHALEVGCFIQRDLLAPVGARRLHAAEFSSLRPGS